MALTLFKGGMGATEVARTLKIGRASGFPRHCARREGFEIQMRPSEHAGLKSCRWPFRQPSTLVFFLQQSVFDQPSYATVPRIVCAHTKICLLDSDERARSGIPEFEGHRIVRAADPRHNPNQRLICAKGLGYACVAAIAIVQFMRLHRGAPAPLTSTRL